MTAIAAAPGRADLIQVPLMLTVPTFNGELTSGAAVHIAVIQFAGLLNIGQAGWPSIKSS